MSEYAPEINAALREWSTDYEIGACVPSAVWTVVADADTYAELCGDPESEWLKGCHSIAPRPMRHVLVIREMWAHEASNTITHEAMHWLAQCSGVFPDDQAAHDESAIWGEGGILARTNEALGLPPD